VQQNRKGKPEASVRSENLLLDWFSKSKFNFHYQQCFSSFVVYKGEFIKNTLNGMLLKPCRINFMLLNAKLGSLFTWKWIPTCRFIVGN